MNIQEYEKVKKYTYLEYCDYLQLLKRYKDFHDNNPFSTRQLLRSWNEKFGLWSDENNAELYKEIIAL